MAEKRISFNVYKDNEFLYFSLLFADADGKSELYSGSIREGESKDYAFTHLLYELMRLDALYGIPIAAQLDILYCLVAEENVDIVEKNPKNI